MEATKSDHMQVLIEKTWDLHGRIDQKISQNGFSFCSHCSNHGRYCVVAESSLEEREKMIAIRDSLKDVHDILVYLQRVKSSQKKKMDDAIARLEESRKLLIERINQCPEKERKLELLEEIITFVGKKTDQFPWNFKMDKRIEQKNVNGIIRFLLHTTRFGLEFAVVFAGIYASAKLCRNRQQYNNSMSRRESMDCSRMEGHELNQFFLTDNSDMMHLDVLYGRG